MSNQLQSDQISMNSETLKSQKHQNPKNTKIPKTPKSQKHQNPKKRLTCYASVNVLVTLDGNECKQSQGKNIHEIKDSSWNRDYSPCSEWLKSGVPKSLWPRATKKMA